MYHQQNHYIDDLQISLILIMWASHLLIWHYPFQELDSTYGELEKVLNHNKIDISQVMKTRDVSKPTSENKAEYTLFDVHVLMSKLYRETAKVKVFATLV